MLWEHDLTDRVTALSILENRPTTIYRNIFDKDDVLVCSCSKQKTPSMGNCLQLALATSRLHGRVYSYCYPLTQLWHCLLLQNVTAP